MPCGYRHVSSLVFFFNDAPTTEIYTLSLHDALPISRHPRVAAPPAHRRAARRRRHRIRSEEHTSELQSRQYLVCRLLLEKKKNRDNYNVINEIFLSSFPKNPRNVHATKQAFSSITDR